MCKSYWWMWGFLASANKINSTRLLLSSKILANFKTWGIKNAHEEAFFTWPILSIFKALWILFLILFLLHAKIDEKKSSKTGLRLAKKVYFCILIMWQFQNTSYSNKFY
jgi:hypothetical protein